jgi:segregation and condensation protein B
VWDDAQLSAGLESVLLAAAGPVSVAELARLFAVSRSRILAALTGLSADLTRGIRLQVHGDRAQLATAPEFSEVVQRFLGTTKPPPLSRSALETLSVVAYRQPVTRPEIEHLRGVNSDRAVESLLARGLIEERGRRDTVGRPMEYGTTFGFLEYFGLTSLEELPPLPADEPSQAAPGLLGLRDRR